MPKKTRKPTSSTKGSSEGATTNARRTAKRREALGKRLAAADALVARRTTQLDAAKERRAGLVARIAALDGADPSGDPVARVGAAQAFCMREKVRVTMRDARPTVLANGHALAGLCPNCGAKVMRMVSSAEHQSGTVGSTPG